MDGQTQQQRQKKSCKTTSIWTTYSGRYARHPHRRQHWVVGLDSMVDDKGL